MYSRNKFYNPFHLKGLVKNLQSKYGDVPDYNVDVTDFDWEREIHLLVNNDFVSIKTVRKIIMVLPRVRKEVEKRYSLNEICKKLTKLIKPKDLGRILLLWFQIGEFSLTEFLEKKMLELDVKVPLSWSWFKELVIKHKKIDLSSWFSDCWQKKYDLSDLFNSLKIKPQWQFSIELRKLWFMSINSVRWDYLIKNQFQLLEGFSDFSSETFEISCCVKWMIQNKIPHVGKSRPKALLERILKRRGKVPETKEQNERYKHFSDDIFQDIKKWYISDNILNFFSNISGDHYRLKFWREILELGIVDMAEPYENISAFYLHVGSLYFIEFGEIGNALYIYRENLFNKLPKKPKNVMEMKDKYSCITKFSHTSSERGLWQERVRLFIEEYTGKNAHSYGDRKQGLFRNYGLNNSFKRK